MFDFFNLVIFVLSKNIFTIWNISSFSLHKGQTSDIYHYKFTYYNRGELVEQQDYLFLKQSSISRWTGMFAKLNFKMYVYIWVLSFTITKQNNRLVRLK